MIVPDSIEPYIGWKALRLESFSMTLFSPQQATPWPPKERLEAACGRGVEIEIEWKWVAIPIGDESTCECDGLALGAHQEIHHPPPTVEPPPGHAWSYQVTTKPHVVATSHACSCGIYVVDNPMRCAPYLDHMCVLAEVAVWGNTIVADKGARGQYAYPQKLIVPAHLGLEAERLAKNYGIPCEAARNELSRAWAKGETASGQTIVRQHAARSAWRTLTAAAALFSIAGSIAALSGFHGYALPFNAGAAVCLAIAIWAYCTR